MHRYVITRQGLHFVREGLWSENIREAHHFYSRHVAQECSLVMVGSRILTVRGEHGALVYDGERPAEIIRHIAGQA